VSRNEVCRVWKSKGGLTLPEKWEVLGLQIEGFEVRENECLLLEEDGGAAARHPNDVALQWWREQGLPSSVSVTHR